MSLDVIESVGKSIDNCIVTFTSRNQLVFEVKENHFYGFLPTKMIQIFFAEHYTGTYAGDSDDEENQSHYMVCQTEYFPLDKTAEAWAAFEKRLKSPEPWKAVGEGFQLRDICVSDPRVHRK
jgi:hypothetical protein